MIINFTTIDEQGNSKNWSMTPNEIQEKYWSEAFDELPDPEDKVISCEVEDVNFESFDDMIMTFVGAAD